MGNKEITYIIFGIVVVVALIFDLGLFSKKSNIITIKKALLQTIFWVILSLGFFVFVWFEDGSPTAIRYLSAYFMEWSLSIDNIFIFILLFTFFNVKEKHYARVLLAGILMAIVFRIIFITVGVVLVDRFHWVLYIFGAFLVYTGIKMFSSGNSEKNYNPEETFIYRLFTRFLPVTKDDPHGSYWLRKNKKFFFTRLGLLVGILAGTDIIFALDSIPAVLAISQEKLVVYTSNIFAVLGLRSLFFLLKGAVNKFDYLQHGIAIVLTFIGLKMLIEIVGVEIPAFVSLIVIIACIFGSILFSIYKRKKNAAV